MRTLLTRWRQDRRGVSAVEFALIAPIMILTLMATIELPRAFSYSQKLNRATRAMADLIARDNLASLDDIYAAGQAIAQPLQAANAGMRLTALGVYTGGVAKVCSADGRGMAARAVGSNLGAAPPAFATPGSRYVMAEVSLPYVPLFPIFPGLKNLVLNRNAIWPIRKGTPYNADPEVILPGGVKCPST
jgi:Flp pilus assembly protein TadG